jgi:hypothetical protein
MFVDRGSQMRALSLLSFMVTMLKFFFVTIFSKQKNSHKTF